MEASVHIAPPSPALSPALSPREEARLRRQIAGLRAIDARDRAFARSEWDKGEFCRRVRDGGLWLRSPEHPAASFLDFVQAVTTLRSRSTIERRLLLVEHYSREEFSTYLQAGTCATALCEITRSDPALQPLLRRLASSGLTVAEVGLLRGAGKALLRRLQGEPEVDLQKKLLSALAADRAKQDRRHNGARAP